MSGISSESTYHGDNCRCRYRDCYNNVMRSAGEVGGCWWIVGGAADVVEDKESERAAKSEGMRPG